MLTYLFSFIFLAGIFYLAALVMSSSAAEKAAFRLRQRLDPSHMVRLLDNRTLNEALDQAGFSLSAKTVNGIRFGLLASWLLITYASQWFRAEPITWTPLLWGLVYLFVTSPNRYLPAGYVLYRFRKRKEVLRDGELISFLKLYENNRMKKKGYIQFPIFCTQVAFHFRYIRQDLLLLAQNTLDQNLESALDQFVERFPNHPFIDEMRTILLTTESLEHDEAVAFLNDQNKTILNISGELYRKRWSYITDAVTIFNTLPSVATFLMVIALVISYVFIVRSNLDL